MSTKDEIDHVTKGRESINTGLITTKFDLIDAFTKVGVRPGMSVMVHTAMSSLGYVVNGPHDIIDALLESIGPEGTMLVSANTSQLSDPSEWKAPSVPEAWVKIIQENMRPFDARTTLIRGRGILPVAFMMYEDVYRSHHPVKSIAAKGKLAAYMTETHPLHESEGEGSPIHKLYLSKGYALMIGVDLTQCTAIHLAEFLADVPYLYTDNFKALVQDERGKNVFVCLRKYPASSQYFYKMHEPLKKKGFLTEIQYRGRAPIILLDVYSSVNYIMDILKKDNTSLRRI